MRRPPSSRSASRRPRGSTQLCPPSRGGGGGRRRRRRRRRTRGGFAGAAARRRGCPHTRPGRRASGASSGACRGSGFWGAPGLPSRSLALAPSEEICVVVLVRGFLELGRVEGLVLALVRAFRGGGVAHVEAAERLLADGSGRATGSRANRRARAAPEVASVSRGRGGNLGTPPREEKARRGETRTSLQRALDAPQGRGRGLDGARGRARREDRREGGRERDGRERRLHRPRREPRVTPSDRKSRGKRRRDAPVINHPRRA